MAGSWTEVTVVSRRATNKFAIDPKSDEIK
jgi:hypothetical protein